MLHVIYRSYGGENRKGRPDYYSKLLALASLIKSFGEIAPGEADLIFLNDGPIPPDRLRLMEKSGEILAGHNLGLRGSMNCALAQPQIRNWPHRDIVWFAEDDYLYLPCALPDLIAAAAAFPDAAYFALYALIGSRLPSSDEFDDVLRVPSAWRGTDPVAVNNHPWCQALSTTSTYGVRVGAHIEDRTMARLASRTGGAWDHTISLMAQGYMPYPLAALMQSFRATADARNLPYHAVVTAARIGLNVYHLARRGAGARKRMLVAADPALITHLETAYMAAGTDWQAVAAETERWLGDTEKT